MAKVSGIWNFYDIISAFPTTSSYNVNFYSNDTQYIGIRKSGGVLYYIASGNVWNAIYDYNDNKWHKAAYKTIDFGDTEQDVNNVFYSWIFSNTTKSVGEIVAEIKYGSSILGRLIKEQKATLTCIDQKMLYDVVVSFVEAGTITYNEKTRDVGANKEATLTCKDKTMLGNVVIYAQSEVVDETAGLFDANDNSVATWTQLESTYGLLISDDYTSANYKTDINSFYNVLENNTSLLSGSKLIISKKISYIGKYALAGCSSFTNITIPNSVTSIGEYAFTDCKFTNIYYTGNIADWCNIEFKNSSSSPNFFGQYLYIDNTKLVNLEIPNQITEIKNYTFFYAKQLQTVTFHNSIEKIGNYAFGGCTQLRNITIPNSVTSIGDWTFYACYAFTNITIPDSVSSIGGYAFYYCSGLTSVTIGDSVTSIGSYAFRECRFLTSVTIKATKPPALSSASVFPTSNTEFKIYVPRGYKDIYINHSTNWSNLDSYIEEKDL